MTLPNVDVRPLPPDRLAPLIGPERAERFDVIAAAAREMLDGRVVLNVNSTASGGGVAEMLQTLLAYARGAGVDARWAVITGNPRFYEITKRIHNHLYGFPGDGGPLGDAEHADYEATLRDNAERLAPFVGAGDIVVLHDPQTAGLAHALAARGASLVWRCHIGTDVPNEHSERAWAFLQPYLTPVHRFVFSREPFAPSFVPRTQLTVIPPSIDPFSAKNEAMLPLQVLDIMRYVGLLDGDRKPPEFAFTRRDGSPGHITGKVDLLGTGALPDNAPLVVQVSRWDAMKDMPGVMQGFVARLDRLGDAHLMLSGPDARGVTDDPEGQGVLDECLAMWEALPRAAREHVHLSCVPMIDTDVAAAICNALQRMATVVVQKSVAEGFGLTVAEAMWKARPVIGGAVGGIVDQIVDGRTGLLVDPHDLDAFGDALETLVSDLPEAAAMGELGRVRALEHFLGDRHLEQWAAALDGLGS